MAIKISFLGGAQEVGRSSYLVDSGDKILLDHGVKLSAEETEYPLTVKTHLNALILSHAHLDHSGNIPHLFDYAHTLVFATPPTFDLSKLLWLDSMKIADKEGLPPQFTNKEIERAEHYSFPTRYNRRLNITENSAFEFFDAGHILGAAMTKLELGGKTLLFTGDFKEEKTRLFPAADIDSVGKVDYLMMESCYGDRDHEPRKEVEKKLVEDIEETLNNGGWALVPAFAIGRSQEIIDLVYEYGLDFPVFFDGMGQTATKIFFNHPEFLNDFKGLKQAMNKVVWIDGRKERKQAMKEPSIIVSTAGMLTGGPIYEYLKRFWQDEKSKLFLTGYQVKGTPGRILREKGLITVDGTPQKVKMQVDMYELSAHAGQTGLIQAVEKFSPEKVILVHGDKTVMDVFAKELKGRGFDALMPKNGQTIELK